MVWPARVAYKGNRKAAFRNTREAAREAESDLLRDLRRQAGDEQQTGARPATMKALFEFYLTDLENRGKGPDTIGRAKSTLKAVERLAPLLLSTPVSRVTKQDLLAFRQAIARVPAKPSTINRDLRTLRAMLKTARPDFRFPGDAFYPVRNNC